MTETDMSTPSGPFAWTDIYRAVERAEERIMKRLDALSDEQSEADRFASESRRELANRLTNLEQRNAVDDARVRGVSMVGNLSQRVFMILLAIVQLGMAIFVAVNI